ncbi:tetratricopeptide repeat protein [Jatrophihabitans sp.]|jgi:tetratricopeptide (TPR) repeat protein|uniref:tetratricopeptide repeat protein n=1 Tax=Jatrophihabitans sp. TaxID=1932789 RepID=UPI002F18238A
MRAPTSAKDYLGRALRHDKAGREAQAVADYMHALKLGLDGADERIALICLASSHRNLGEHDQALKVISRARRRYPEDPVVEAFAALILLDAGQPNRAVRILGLALCNHARPDALDGFDTVLTRKFRGATRPSAAKESGQR